jgi:CDP-glucose 4,6-dehydratase
MPFHSFYKGKKVLVTGDTGFKGSWLSLWLLTLGADVHGVALEPSTDPALFDLLSLRERIHHTTLDIRDPQRLERHVKEIRPEIVFHLAAQAIVRHSYSIPLETLETNILGTANLLQAITKTEYSPQSPCHVVVITSDKCYENRETSHAYREDDRLGGHDPYSCSKAAAELVVSSWRRSFFRSPQAETAPAVSVATCRAGNVIGGGDWSPDRIVVDAIRALSARKPIQVRNPLSVRPWQHVLEPLSGYLQVGSLLGHPSDSGAASDTAWNFGPGREAEKTVGELCDSIIRFWGSGEWHSAAESQPVHEARFLKLAIDKASHHLGWKPVWDFDTTVEKTVSWYRTAEQTRYESKSLLKTTESQIHDYQRDATNQSIPWAVQ